MVLHPSALRFRVESMPYDVSHARRASLAVNLPSSNCLRKARGENRYAPAAASCADMPRQTPRVTRRGRDGRRAGRWPAGPTWGALGAPAGIDAEAGQGQPSRSRRAAAEACSCSLRASATSREHSPYRRRRPARDQVRMRSSSMCARPGSPVRQSECSERRQPPHHRTAGEELPIVRDRLVLQTSRTPRPTV